MTIEPEFERIRKKARSKVPPKLSARQRIASREARHGGLVWISICGLRDCPREGGYHGTPMCEDHAWQVWATLDALKGHVEAQKVECQRLADIAEQEEEADAARIAHLKATWKPKRWIEPGWVYYLLVGERIKIGYSTDVHQRLKQYPPNSSLLALHPGTLKLEREMHHKFLHRLAEGREWFHIADDVIKHIEIVRTDFPGAGYPVISTLDGLNAIV